MSKHIPVGHGKFAIVDDEDFGWLSGYNWHCDDAGYAMRNLLLGEEDSGAIRMHREVNRTPKGFDTDHVNGNRLDNRKLKLRTANSSQNQFNRGKTSANTSGYKGVFWHRVTKKWRAQIGYYGKIKHLGYFHDAVDAAETYDIAAHNLFGEFARFNFPDGENIPAPLNNTLLLGMRVE